ncbi:patatin-like phospholipase family protein [Desulfonatronovibrio magnus]|uniref:patatin-like phospholipase family protein n=1 Tax=Desulfonatronovibrio magnus TaxID=698827 RepID=UPI0006983DC2|nr:patatin-like phospholipase family protein [Desulfonatronovibrio magnus]
MRYESSKLSRRNFLTAAGMTAVWMAVNPLKGSWSFAGQENAVSIGLALGSGGATGLAHIPVLEVFDELEIRPCAIAGSSIGAIMGALYASGLSGKEIREIVQEFSGDNFDVFRSLVKGDSGLQLMDILRLDLDAGGLVDSQGFLNFMKEKIKVSSFEELDIPLYVVAADYWKKDQVVMSSGDLISAVKASMAVPGLFAPVPRDGRLLVDGGTVNPLPYDLLEGKCDYTVAIDVSGEKSDNDSNEIDFTDSLFNTFEIMQQAITAQKMKWLKPDLYIKPEVRDIRLLHFHRSKEIFEQTAPAAKHLRLELEAMLAAN